MSTKQAIRKSIIAVVDTVELHDFRYDHKSLRQAANQLADYCQAGKMEPDGIRLLKNFLDSIPLSFSHNISQVLDYIRERYGDHG